MSFSATNTTPADVMHKVWRAVEQAPSGVPVPLRLLLDPQTAEELLALSGQPHIRPLYPLPAVDPSVPPVAITTVGSQTPLGRSLAELLQTPVKPLSSTSTLMAETKAGPRPSIVPTAWSPGTLADSRFPLDNSSYFQWRGASRPKLGQPILPPTVIGLTGEDLLDPARFSAALSRAGTGTRLHPKKAAKYINALAEQAAIYSELLPKDPLAETTVCALAVITTGTSLLTATPNGKFALAVKWALFVSTVARLCVRIGVMLGQVQPVVETSLIGVTVILKGADSGCTTYQTFKSSDGATSLTRSVIS
jgi:hypothetical protein